MLLILFRFTNLFIVFTTYTIGVVEKPEPITGYIRFEVRLDPEQVSIRANT